MSRRASLPGADELFRVTGGDGPAEDPPQTYRPPVGYPRREPGSTRPRHEEKVTFYCTPADLARLERARLELRTEHSMAVDRGRLVRAAVAAVLDDFERRGVQSDLIRRLASGG